MKEAVEDPDVPDEAELKQELPYGMQESISSTFPKEGKILGITL
jgi:hypothetical protein